MRGIVWFRRDLRLDDQPAFAAACEECDEVIPLFVFDEPLLQSHGFGAACVNFMLGCLEELQSSLAELGLAMQWRRGFQVDEVLRAALEWEADVVYWNRDYEPRALMRDQAMQNRLAREGIATKTYKDHVVFEAEEVRGATGEPLQRYSAYRARWWARWHAIKPTVHAVRHPSMITRKAVRLSSVPLPTANELGYEHLVPWITPGERCAHEQLRWFVEGPIHRYADGRNRPASEGSSKLSPHLRFGTLSSKIAVHAALESLSHTGPVSRTDVLTWIDELIWREFFQQVLAAFPHVVDGPFRNTSVPPSRDPGPERDRLFRAWCDGNTGYPIVDAGMRQLNQTGWMHNRVRMIVASFLIKDLRIDWQSGEQYFMRHLLDADLAANNGNWQWCASTGTDSMPGYRIFNPALQSRKFDPDGVYIRQYVPELVSVSSRRIHEPHLMTPEEQEQAHCRIGINYPSPVVDHQLARQEYLNLGQQEATR
ncbi:MAG TPA: deoxyribodipyrimidine photo-lyase [Nitrospira sp.]|nr:deoxyribodipyrimidine photo-lyase [Nitrospira sp.]